MFRAFYRFGVSFLAWQIGGFLAVAIIMFGIEELPPDKASIGASLQPIFTAAFLFYSLAATYFLIRREVRRYIAARTHDGDNATNARIRF